MSKSIFWVVLCTALIAFRMKAFKVEPKKSRGHELSHFILERHERLRRAFPENEHADLLISTTLGEKRWLNPKTRKLHQRFNLTHLFTPSGLHFSSLMLLVRFFVRAKWWRSLFYLAPLGLSGFYSCKRVGLLLFIKQLFPKLSLYTIFLGAMALDYAFGTFRENPHSFLFSFTFLGIFIASAGESKLRLYLSLIMASIVLSYFQALPFSPWGILIGLFLTPIFSLFFPLLFLNIFIPQLAILTGPLLQGWLALLAFIPPPQFYVEASLPLMLALLFAQKIPRVLFIAILLFHSEDCLNEKRSRFRRGFEKPLPEYAVSFATTTKSGLRQDSKDWRLRCRFVLNEGEWWGRCHDLPQRKKKLVAK